jgi:hypothetical protein
MHERVELADTTDPRETDFGVREQESPALEVEFVRFTVPEKPFNALTVMVEFAREPGLASTDVGVAVTLKSGIATKYRVIVALCVRALLLPLTVAR